MRTTSDDANDPRAILRVSMAMVRAWRDQARRGDAEAARKAKVIAEHVKEFKAHAGPGGRQ